jgi:hypothetical protein
VKSSTVPILNSGSDQASAQALQDSAVNAAYYNQSLRATYIKVFDTQASAQVIGTF